MWWRLRADIRQQPNLVIFHFPNRLCWPSRQHLKSAIQWKSDRINLVLHLLEWKCIMFWPHVSVEKGFFYAQSRIHDCRMFRYWFPIRNNAFLRLPWYKCSLYLSRRVIFFFIMNKKRKWVAVAMIYVSGTLEKNV